MSNVNWSALTTSDALIAKLDKLGLRHPFDLILHLPLRYEDETQLYPIAAAPLGIVVLVEGVVTKNEVQRGSRPTFKAMIADESGESLQLRFLHFYPDIHKKLAVGQRVRALGEIKRGFMLQEMIHPKLRSVEEGEALPEALTPVYSTVSGLTQLALRKLIQKAFDTLDLKETLPEFVKSQLNLIGFDYAVRQLHYPVASSGLQLSDTNVRAWQRLKFDELLAQQLSMRLAYDARQSLRAPKIQNAGKLRERLLATLPFALTNAQNRVLLEIIQDLSANHPMHRLLQGDVGSGKTVVAAMSALCAIESGFQVALMAPTEILAEQHYLKLKSWLEPLGVELAWLSGSLRKKEKREMMDKIASGHAKLAIGTHALFQDDVVFDNLGLAIVDEQHRFGVGQRIALQNKGGQTHQLMMTATPIPRTLAMSYYADLEVSVIDELPPGRTPIITKLINANRRDELIQYVHQECLKGQQAYWVCPLIEESETLQLQTAVDTHLVLQAELAMWQIGLVHGKMKAVEKAEVMAKFAKNEYQVLVATTVIEVGVDVPNASLMVIEHAERMGLSQLHQLRGRVGRGSAASRCVLMFETPLSQIAKLRLKVIYENDDGFEIAKQDLLIRGPGEFLGAKQSGVPMLRFANLEEDLPLLESAKDWAPIFLERYPNATRAHLERWLSGKEHYLRA